MSLDICPICLRTDRKLKAIASLLSVYHDELTDYSLEIMDPRYCTDCEYLLRKTYKFHQKCSAAAKTLNKWMKIKTKNKMSPNQLHLKLPPISLDLWIPENSKVFTYDCSDDLNTSTLEEESDKPDTDTIKEEVIENSVHSEDLFKIEIHCKDNQITEVSETLFQNSNLQSEDTTNVFHNKLNNDNTVSNVGTTETTVSERNNISRNSKNYTVNKTLKSAHGIISKSSQEVDKSKDTAKVTRDIIMPKLTDDMPILTDNIPKSTCDMSKLTNDMPRLTDDSNNKSASMNETEDMDAEVICLDDNDSTNDDVIVIDEDNEYPDDASLNSDDDCDDYLYPPPRTPRTRKRKMTLDELANIALSDEDFDHDYGSDNRKKTNTSAKKEYSIDRFIISEKRVTSKLKNISETLDTICENWEIPSLLGIPNQEAKKITSQLLTEKNESEKNNSMNTKYKPKGIKIRLAHMDSELDLINEKCMKIVEDYKNELKDPKERLKAELMRKFESWGELKTEDGVILDKEIIINCLGMVSERLIEKLLTFLNGATSLSPGASVILKRIQNKQLESQYESVFDIEYLRTEKEMLEEFKRRKTYKSYVEANFKCKICYQGFKYERQMDYHKKAHNESKGSILCTICCTRHRSARALTKHMTTHSAVYKCKLCPLVTHYKISMVNHYEQHKGTLYKCEACETTYKSKSAYLSHMTHGHPTGSHVCTFCGRSFISVVGLKFHTKRKHQGEAPVGAGGADVRCEPCGLTFPSQEAYSRHQRILHRAPLAHRTKKSPKFLKPRKKPIMTCRVCAAVGHSYGWLVLHFSTEHPSVDMAMVYADKQTYLCDVCGKGFSNKYSLDHHIEFHTGITFPCPSCTKGFATRAALRRHRLTHGPPGFSCERCDKKFHSYPNLYNHMRTHIGDRRFKCNICNKGFLHRFSLKEHIRGVHHHQRRPRKRRVREITLGVTDTSYEVTDPTYQVTAELHDGIEIEADRIG